MSQSNSESFRICFSMSNEQQVREYQFLTLLGKKERQQFLHLAVAMLAGRIGYAVPEGGFMELLTALLNAGVQSERTFVPREKRPAPLRKPAVSTAKPQTRRNNNVQTVSTEKNEDTEICENDADIASAILASLSAFDDALS